jgi:hypothetical protein
VTWDPPFFRVKIFTSLDILDIDQLRGRGLKQVILDSLSTLRVCLQKRKGKKRKTAIDMKKLPSN